jgi:hypothetical protein
LHTPSLFPGQTDATEWQETLKAGLTGACIFDAIEPRRLATNICVLKFSHQTTYGKVLEVLTMADMRKSTLPTKEQISQRAYDFYVARGCEDGHDLSDWVEAERELSESNEPQIKKTRAATASL